MLTGKRALQHILSLKTLATAAIIAAILITLTPTNLVGATSNTKPRAATEDCGITTCSLYLSRHSTTSLNNFLNSHLGVGTVALTQFGLCAALVAATEGTGGVPCTAFMIALDVYGSPQINKAASVHGCLRIRYTRPIYSSFPFPHYDTVVTGLYVVQHGSAGYQYCHD